VNTSPYVIETHELSKTYKKLQALRSLDLKVQRDSIFGFLGPNGAGKTTTIKLALGLIVLLAASCSRLRDLSSRPVNDPLAAFPGKIQVLIYWDKACTYCEQQLAEVEAVYDRWSGMGIVVVAIDVGDTREDVLKTVEERGYSFPVLSGAGWDDLETHSVPYTVVHVNGKVIGRRIGYLSVPEMEGMLKDDEP
jgi:energy-coupling factor transporter ATP-binding protein EcfA2